MNITQQPVLDAIKDADALRDANSLPEAIDAYSRAILMAPDLALGHYKLGTALSMHGDRVAAMASYREALKLQPGYPLAANNLALLLVGAWKFDAAEELYRTALAGDPDYPEAHLNLGNLLLEKQRGQEAIYYLRRATTLRPEWALAWGRLGMAWSTKGNFAEALDAYRKALTLNSQDAGTWNDMGTVYYGLGRHDEAEEAYLKALQLEPGHASTWMNYLLGSNYHALPRDEVARRHKAFGEQIALQRTHPVRPPQTNLDPGRKLRVGIVSGDLRRHSVSFFIEPVLRHLDTGKIELWAYANHPAPDPKTIELQSRFARWREIKGLTDEAVDACIRRDRIDILIDLSGHTAHSRIHVFARKPAPIQVSWIGYPNTTGLDTVDYRITDRFADPSDEDQLFHTETLWRLPSGFLCYAPPEDAPAVRPPPATANGFITFGSFNALSKISPQCLELWARVLLAVPNSVLMLKSYIDLTSAIVRNRLLAQLATLGIDAHRVILRPPESLAENHLDAYGDIDIALDTLPYNGTTTTCEALWMGVPVITLTGDRHVARVGTSLLQQVGMGDCAAPSDDEFVRIAVTLASDIEALEQRRAGMRKRLAESTLLDGALMARQLEDAFRSMWLNHCRVCQPDLSAADSQNLTLPPGDWAVTLSDGVKFVVEDSYHSISTWVALEQEDWFEDEIKFLRAISRPDWNVIDVGANHGIYSLALAARGVAGIVAFEPTSEPLGRFRRSIAINGFGDRIQPVAMGLSDSRRSVNILLSSNSELNSLNADDGQGSRRETIQLIDLDSFLYASGEAVTAVDFVKLDAEGEEEAILRGGARFFSEQSPLVMFEFKHGTALNLPLLGAFRRMNYAIYRLIPGAGCLVPVVQGSEASLDGFTLNLFACNSERAAQMESMGTLTHSVDSAAIELQQEWLVELRALPLYATDPGYTHWSLEDITDPNYSLALLAWCGSRRRSASGAERVALLNRAREHVQLAACNDEGHPATAILGIRIFSDLGERATALAYAGAVTEQIDADDLPDDRPLPPAWTAFDQRSPVTSRAEFLFASVLEFMLREGSYSSCFSPSNDLLLNAVLSCADHTPETERVAMLWCARDHRPFRLPLSAAVFSPTEDNRNPDVWRNFAADHGFLDDLPGIIENRTLGSPSSFDTVKPSPTHKSIADLLTKEELITIVDVGASPNSSPPPYAELLRSKKAVLVGFEPNSDARTQAEMQFGPPSKFLSCFVGDGEQATFYETNIVQTGSLYRPNQALLEKFSFLNEQVTLVDQHIVNTTRLDDLPDLVDVDFLKMDVQGAELLILQNAKNTLRNVICIQVEVEFVQLYENQPLFADVDTFLRQHGFQFHTFDGSWSRCFAPISKSSSVTEGYRQILWSDGVYVRDWMHFDLLAPAKLRKLAVLLNDVYHSYDLAHLALHHADRMSGTHLAEAYRKSIS